MIVGLASVLLASWAFTSQVTASDGESLRIVLDAPSTCNVDADAGTVSPTLEIGWEVRGGVAPYRVFVHGRYSAAPEGSESALCGVWKDGRVNSGQMPILARVTDAAGGSASALSYTQAVRVIRSDASPNERTIGLHPEETYLIHGILLTIPAGVGFGLGPYVSHPCPPDENACNDEFPLHLSGNTYGSTLWLRRWHQDESRRVISERDDAEHVNALFDQVAASIGRAAGTLLQSAALSETDSDDFRIELRAPEICETYWGRYGGSRQAIQVEWEIHGGQAPYRVHFADQTQEGDRGVISVPCGDIRDDADGVDSQIMNSQAVVVDANGDVASGVVSTYVISSNRHGGSSLRGGWTHRVMGLLMTIPEGFEFDVEFFGAELVDCEPEEEEEEEQEQESESDQTAVDAILAQTGLPPANRNSDRYRCQNLWSMSGEWTIDGHNGSMWVSFGETTKDVTHYGVELDESSAGVRGSEQAQAEAERRVWQLAHSVGEPPSLPETGVFNPAPLRLRAWAEPLTCGWLYDGHRSRQASGQRRVAGGAWWPLGIGNEAWSDEHLATDLDCPAELGPHQSTLETHESGPDAATAEATVTHYAVPAFVTDDLSGSGRGWPTSYCAPRSTRTIHWTVNGGSGAYRARVNGADVEMDYHAEYRFGNGWTQVSCADRLGLQAMTVEVWVEAEPNNRIVFPVLLMAVEEHPSGLPWSEFE